MASSNGSNDPVMLGVLSGVFLMVAATGAHWFITPDVFTASVGRRIGVGLQIVVGLGVAIWAYRRARRVQRAGDTAN